MKAICIMEKFILVCADRGLYFQYWTEGNVVFLTEDALNAETYKSIISAKDCRSRINSYHNNIQFLSEETEKEIGAPTLKVAKVIVSHKFVE